MSQQTYENVEALDEAIGPEVAAILEFTSNIGVSEPGELTYITSKDAYLWAGVAAFLGRCATPPDPISDIEIKTAVFQFVVNASRVLAANYRSVPSFVASDQSTRYLFDHTDWLCRTLIDRFSLPFPADFDKIESINQLIETGYRNCIRLELISDPIIETSLGLAILGFVPFSVVKKTKKGNTTYFKLRAGLWKYERQKQTDGSIRYDWTFETARIARALKAAIISAYHDATKGEGDEPV